MIINKISATIPINLKRFKSVHYEGPVLLQLRLQFLCAWGIVGGVEGINFLLFYKTLQKTPCIYIKLS